MEKRVFDYENVGKKGKIEQVLLLSQSPRRRNLLTFLNPVIETRDVDERAIEEHFMKFYQSDDFVTRAAKTCCEISKAKSDLPLDDGVLAISADTIVIHEGKIYNKPEDLEEARQMFLSYFSKSHVVATSVCLRTKDWLEVFYCLAEIDFVDFYPELEPVVEEYLLKKQPLDKAGAYGIQELDPRFIKEIRGDIHTIIGLPVAETAHRIFNA
ncbi:Maf-like protein [Streptococcus sp. X16XC17]|uniref:Maf family protein n=1 Tax=unclassified Streptococcus TaxID=2608887 RepID=UPI00066FBD50|nr:MULTISPECIES: Maf family protein [unclassified Streptococcus]TCD46375.1 Maf-like protein [Streptococcus sp. X16XC17]